MTPRSPNPSHRRDELRESARPLVRLNLAITADGKIATANRAISAFGSKHDLKRLYQLRHRADAILCGAGTINAENADLGPAPGRPAHPPFAVSRLPLRVIASGRGYLNPEARLFQRAYGPIVILATRRISAARRRRLESLAHTVKICGTREIDFLSALRWLRSKWNVRELLCEGGSQVNAALLAADLIDEINLTLCPWIVGGRTSPTLADGRGVADLAQTSPWRLERALRRGNELFLRYRRLAGDAQQRRAGCQT